MLHLFCTSVISNIETIHPMDCADVVVGQARGQRFRILDYYTRDRSTPRRDSFYGGEDDITAAVGKEVNGMTSIKFRRQVVTGEYVNTRWSNSLRTDTISFFARSFAIFLPVCATFEYWLCMHSYYCDCGC